MSVDSNVGGLPFTRSSGNSDWKVNGTRLFGSFQWKISGSNGTSEKVVLFSRTECSKRKFVFYFFKPSFDTSFRLSRLFFGKRDWFVQKVNAISERNLPVLDFVYHLPKPLSGPFAHVNGKQLLCLLWVCLTSIWLDKKGSSHFLNQSEVKAKPIVICLHAFCRAWR